ncbi:MerR family transcriptional regulator [Corynebacterium guangdongense]|uniref:DNA-binding transcriptional MerR regulator n=1 Tax=Corynebacterium guangdongense TaxID=1783348 RepID=A0ABU2A0Z5_9CORY|nr:MerR family transcriptional regulator [Corynebacterium guangdongense]MDR7330836.1 DNA-binding transcriptional MerR regulator [Corynebacterium guangdongense]WJZ16851.1 HTH-type transcriptional regulator HmrR [Corynebacterium guangdongense]
MDDGLKIGEITEKTGLSIPTLRHYDSVGLVTPSGRSPGGFRLYNDEDIRRILLVRRMKPLGFTLEQMRDFLDAADALREGAADTDAAEARATLAQIRDEARARYEKLRKQVAYAEEFIDLVDGLEA